MINFWNSLPKNKLQNEFVSIEEFCHYTSLKQDQIKLLIIG